MERKLYVMIGLPGSGKSTYAKSVSEGKTAWINADSVRKEINGSEASQDNPAKVWKIVYERYEEALKDPSVQTIIVDNTSIKYKDRKDYYTMAEKFGLTKISVVYFNLPLATVLKRNKGRERQVPEDVIMRMKSNLEPPNAIEKQKYEVINVTK